MPHLPHDPDDPSVPHDGEGADNVRDVFALVKSYLERDDEGIRAILANSCTLCIASFAAAQLAWHLQHSAERQGADAAALSRSLGRLCRGTVSPDGAL